MPRFVLHVVAGLACGAFASRHGRSDDTLLARCPRGVGGDAAFVARCTSTLRCKLASSARSVAKRMAEAVAERPQELGATASGEAANVVWAEAMLGAFPDRELVCRGNSAVEPAVAALCKLAEREPTTLPVDT